MLDPATWDHDACVVGLIADRHARPSHEWLSRGLEALRRLTHRGATGDGHSAADGTGVLTKAAGVVIAQRPVAVPARLRA